MANDWETEGKKKKLKGKFQEFTGEMLGDDSERLKGKMNQAAGSLQENLGQAGHKIEREARGRDRGVEPQPSPGRETIVHRETRIDRDHP